MYTKVKEVNEVTIMEAILKALQIIAAIYKVVDAHRQLRRDRKSQ